MKSKLTPEQRRLRFKARQRIYYLTEKAKRDQEREKQNSYGTSNKTFINADTGVEVIDKDYGLKKRKAEDAVRHNRVMGWSNEDLMIDVRNVLYQSTRKLYNSGAPFMDWDTFQKTKMARKTY